MCDEPICGIRISGFGVGLANVLRRSQELEGQLKIDPLTKVGNRNLLDTNVERLLASSGLVHHAIVMIDMDHFKMTNDTYGHGVGDRLLQQFARGLERLSRSSLVEESRVVRLGGDEFVVTFHDVRPVDLDDLERRLDQLRSETIAIASGAHLAIEFSFGIAVATGSPELQGLLDAADLAAYQEKADRRTTLEPALPRA